MIRLERITWGNYEDVIALKVTDDQKEKKFVASNLYTLAQCYVGKTNNENEKTGPEGTFAIYHDDVLVGFSMSIYETDDGDDEGDLFDDKTWYNILRFMIDKKHQNKGYGKQALLKLIEYLKTFPNGEATAIISSYTPNNTVMQKIFESLGFEEVGFDDDDKENVVRLQI